MYTVSIRGLEFYAYHGVPDAEQEVGHRYVVDVAMRVDGGADVSDDVGETVDYGLVARQVCEWACSARFRTIERLARHLGEGIMKEHQRVNSLEITVAKRLPPAPVIAESASVTLTMERGTSR